MKKSINYLLGVLLLAITMVIVSGCSNQSSVEVKEEQYSTSSSDISEINISVKDRAIEILPSSDGEIHITYSQNDKEFYQIGLDNNGVLTMQSASNKELSDFFGLKGDSMRSIKLEVPNPLPCDLVISSTKNDINIPEIVIEGNIDIQINDGTIFLENVLAQSGLTLYTKNGNISGTLNGTYEEFNIQSKAHKGESNLPENKAAGIKELNANTNNGNIEIAFTGSN